MTDRAPSGSSRKQPRLGDESVGQFVIGSEIGKGSFAQVYLGKHKISGAAVAIKSVELARLNKKLKENLYGEIKILKTLRHPHIVALHDCVESATHINLVMEYCELGDLSLFIKKRDKLLTNPATHDMARKYPSAPNSGLNEVVIRHFLKQLCSALKFLREGNFVHRDVKPQNLLLLPSPKYRDAHKAQRPILTASHDSLIPVAGLASLPMLKLADFGFARVLPSTSLAETLCGSPLYMAPEILRYERYDAKADLWSVGTVLFEMVTGRPPFRASNHVELLRKIEAAEDVIKFPRESIVSPEMKSLIRALLKRNPVERLSFENFFTHPVVTNPIPGLVEDDAPPRPETRVSKDARTASRTDDPLPSPRRSSFRRFTTDNEGQDAPTSPLDRVPRQSGLSAAAAAAAAAAEGQTRLGQSPRNESAADGLGIRRPQAQPSVSAPNRPALHSGGDRRHRTSNASLNRPSRDSPSPTSSVLREVPPPTRTRLQQQQNGKSQAEELERAAQDVAFERDYVVVEKKHVEVNAFADEMAANPRLGGPGGPLSPKAGHMVRRATQQGVPTSTTGAVAPAQSRAMQVAQGAQRHLHERQGSLSGSPGSAASFITKAIQDASLRLLGIKYPPAMNKGTSPPQLYNPFPAYPTPQPPVGLIGDGKQGAPMDEDVRVAQALEDYATRSDVVYGFAEVKFKQLVPLAPSIEHALGGIPADKISSMAGEEEEDVLTVEAIVGLSEEALVLYVKCLALLAKSMDIASLWWARKNRGDVSSHVATTSSASMQALTNRVNSAVQWVRGRFNEVLEKAELVRLKLVEAQSRLPDDHPSHPSNHPRESDSAAAANSASADGVFLTAGMTAEKLMYERALEMSRMAAINEITNEDLTGCEISYVTAIRMLEAVLDNDEDVHRRRISPASRDDDRNVGRAEERGHAEINPDDQQQVLKMIQMIKSRLSSVRGKMQLISNVTKTQQQPQQQQQTHHLVQRRSGDLTPRSTPTYAS